MNQDKHTNASPERASDPGGPSLAVWPGTGQDLEGRDWPGHLPPTRAALEQILVRASLGHADFNLAERVFVQACELRSQLAAGGWTMRVWEHREQLDVDRCLLLALGAERLSEDLARTVDKVKAAASRQSEKAMLRHLERRLAAQGATLDLLLARYAERLTSRPESPGVSS